MALEVLKENNNQKNTPLTRLKETSESDLKQCADKNLGTKFRKRGNPLYLAFLIGRPMSTTYYDISLRRNRAPHGSAHAVSPHADASVDDRRAAARSLQTMRSASHADDNWTHCKRRPWHDLLI